MKRPIFLLAVLLLRAEALELHGYFDGQEGLLQNYFIIFYGQKEQLLSLPVSLDFQYDQILLTNKDLDDRGVECVQQRECYKGKKEISIFDNGGKYLISVAESQVNLLLAPELFGSQLVSFYLKSNAKYY